MSSKTSRLTVAQAVVRFLANQYSERDGVERRLIAGCFGIFGHGNVAGMGQALLEAELSDPSALPYHQGRNEQAMVHASAAYARMKDRLSTLACTASIGPGATNMLTGAALATINRIPVLLLPGDIFATRVASPVLQELEVPSGYDVSVNDAFRPVSRFFDRVWRPEQLPQALLGAMRVLTDPVETGAVTIALPQDVQAEAYDWPEELFEKRVWNVSRPVPEPAALARAVAVIREAERPMIVAGGGVIYSQATDALREFVDATGIPVGQSQAGKGALPYDHPLSLGAIGSTGTTAANRLARDADVVIGIGTRYSDFTTASRTAFGDRDVRFVNINVAAFDVAKHAAVGVVADAREALVALREALSGWHVDDAYRNRATELAREWDEIVEAAYTQDHGPLPAQSEVIGVVNEVSDPSDVVVCAAGSMPGDLHKLWRTRDPKGYHVEYGYSCMGYEITGGLGIEDGMSGPRRVRDGRGRLLLDDGAGVGHRRPGTPQDHRGASAEPRVRLHRGAVRGRRRATVRYLVPLPQPRDRTPRRRRPAGGSRGKRRELGRPGAARNEHRGVPVCCAGGEEVRRGRAGPGARGDRPASPGAEQRVVVGRPRRRGS